MDADAQGVLEAVEMLEKHVEQLNIGGLDDNLRRSLADRLKRVAKQVGPRGDRPSRSAEKLRSGCRHLKYEIEMFYKQGRDFLSGEFGGATLFGLNEAFFVHARILAKFLYETSP